uniref:NitT/TauT family transport system permease protein n=1 Tax=Candidatus Kentrum sp. TUN TaxID=2126343 RepID=A0A450ZGQ7_9GAMM|nr:MAG: NitT/TauT family transport system permease protein [Candidatus Kentron sp. TUN]VFK53520.1 MAG: NitT/TauT family transport system permease protein [Candidatus Kentron sp. TUN]
MVGRASLQLRADISTITELVMESLGSSTAPSAILLIVIILGVGLFFFYKGIFSAFSILSKGKLTSWQGILVWICSFVLFFSLWDIVSQLESEGINKIPSPVQTFAAAERLLVSGKLLSEAWVSCLRVAIGFVAASLVGVTIGLLAGSFLLINRLVVPVTSFLRYIPPTAFISLLIVYFGIGETYKYAVIFFGVVFFIIQMVIDVVEDIDRRFLEMALTMGHNNWSIFKEVVIPASWPRIWDVLRINLSASWTFLVAAEIIGAERGLGHLISVSQRYLRIDDLYVGILIFGIIGIVTDRVLEWISRNLFRWHYVTINR